MDDKHLTLNWDVNPGDKYRVYKSPTPDFSKARLLLWTEVDENEWTDNEIRPRSRIYFYRVEKNTGTSSVDLHFQSADPESGRKEVRKKT
jgi:hypothetical protein